MIEKKGRNGTKILDVWCRLLLYPSRNLLVTLTSVNVNFSFCPFCSSFTVFALFCFLPLSLSLSRYLMYLIQGWYPLLLSLSTESCTVSEHRGLIRSFKVVGRRVKWKGRGVWGFVKGVRSKWEREVRLQALEVSYLVESM